MKLLCAHCVQFADVFKCNKNAKLWQTKLHKQIAMFWITERLLGLHRVHNLVTNATLCTLLKQWEEDYPAEHVEKDVTIPDTNKRAKKDDEDKHNMMTHSKTANRWCRQTYIENRDADRLMYWWWHWDSKRCKTNMHNHETHDTDAARLVCWWQHGGRKMQIFQLQHLPTGEFWRSWNLHSDRHNWAHFLLLVSNKVCHFNKQICL